MKLLVATDFSANANHALKLALDLFGENGAEIALLNAVHTPQAGAIMTVDLAGDLLKKGEENLQSIRRQILMDYPSCAVEVIVKPGSLASVITYETDNNRYDYVVMGTNGVTGLYEKMIGSNTREVMNLVEVPLIVVPYNCPVSSVETMLMAVDSVTEDLSKLEKCADFCRQVNSALHIMHFTSSEEKMEPFQIDTTMFSGISFSLDQVMTLSGEVEDHILNFAKKDNVGMVAIVPHHKSFLKGLFHRSTSENILTKAKIPLLIV